MTTRQASLPGGLSVILLMLVTTVFARTWSDSEVSRRGGVLAKVLSKVRAGTAPRKEGGFFDTYTYMYDRGHMRSPCGTRTLYPNSSPHLVLCLAVGPLLASPPAAA